MKTQFVLAVIRARALRWGFRGVDLDDAVQHAYLHLWKYCKRSLIGHKRHVWKLIRPIDQALYKLHKAWIDYEASVRYYDWLMQNASEQRMSLWRVYDFAKACKQEGGTGEKLYKVLMDSSEYYAVRGSRVPSAASIAKFIETTPNDLKRMALRTRKKLKEVSMRER